MYALQFSSKKFPTSQDQLASANIEQPDDSERDSMSISAPRYLRDMVAGPGVSSGTVAATSFKSFGPCVYKHGGGKAAMRGKRLWLQNGRHQILASPQTPPPLVAKGDFHAAVGILDVRTNYESDTASKVAAPDLATAESDGELIVYLGSAETTRYGDRKPRCSKCGRCEGQIAYPSVPVEQRRHMPRKSNNKHSNAYSAPQSQPRNAEPFPHDRSSLNATPPQQHPTAEDLSWFTTPGILISETADKALVDELMTTGIADSTLLSLTDPNFMDWCTDSRRVVDFMTGNDVGTLDPADPLDRFLIRTNPTSSNSN
ncbi:hypothetical protein FIBSPDRAFT_984105 [Athelia psychrophila]|uniref:Uncharacterized protein n=1 Tax=Athelia psychrophila TaxID=1759441 RepID=A0A166BVB2_9AGAM|nr:hypothetical protein FIBSPDRAFT_984105 [Fibularhizoctonia sp. CBS 109695]